MFVSCGHACQAENEGKPEVIAEFRGARALNDLRAAQQLGGIVVLPIILVLTLGSLFAFMPADLLALVISGVLAIAAAALFYVSKATFRREEILTRWK